MSIHTTTPSNTASSLLMGDVPLAEVRRNGVTESVHCGSVVVTNARGTILYAAGNPRRLTFARSALKPFQAASFFARDGVNRLGLTLSESALLCASHSGESIHVEGVASILRKINAVSSDLKCGCHVPYQYSWFNKQPPHGVIWNELHHNCSGKHAGFLAKARLEGHTFEGYLDSNHPVQIESKATLAECVGLSEHDLVVGTDGCSAPTFALPLNHLAQGYARLALGHSIHEDDRYGDDNLIQGLDTAFKAMTRHPEMVSGQGRNDLAFSQAGEEDWVCKIGAEGIQTIGIRSLGLGIALKISDGNMRGLYPATVAVLEQLGLMNERRKEQLHTWAKPILNNVAGLPVGDIIPAVVLREF